MKMRDLIHRMEMDADRALDREIEEEKLLASKRTITPETRHQADIRQLRNLRAQTSALKDELKVRHELEAEWKRLIEVSLQLQEENMTSEERRLRDAEIDRMRRVFSRVCPEASPDWREDAERKFQSRYATQKKL
jgi:hypothetical protein